MHSDGNSDGDNDDLLFGRENEPTSERGRNDFVAGPSAKNASALASSYPRRKCCLQSPVTVLQFLLTSNLVKKHQRVIDVAIANAIAKQQVIIVAITNQIAHSMVVIFILTVGALIKVPLKNIYNPWGRAPWSGKNSF